MFRFKSIKSKFFLFICALIFLPAGVFICVVEDLDRKSFSEVKEVNETLMTHAIQDEWEHKTQVLASLLAKKCIQPMYEYDVAEMDYLANLCAEEKSLRYVYILDEKGRVVVDTTQGSKLLGKVLTDELSKKAITAKGPMVQRQADAVDIASPILLGSNRIGTVRMGFSTEDIRATTAIMTRKVGDSIDKVIGVTLRNTLILLLGVSVLALIAGWGFMRGLMSPIDRLVEGTERVGKGDITYRIEEESEDEIGRLAASFNRMTEDLQKTTVSKGFVDDIIKSMAGTLIVVTPEANIKMVNHATRDLLGYKEDELIGRPISTIFAGGEQAVKKAVFDDLIEKGFINNVERTYLSKDGREIPVFFSGSVMRHGDEVQGAVCVATDVSEYKRMEKELRESEERFRSLIRTAPSVILYLSPDYRILEFNREAERVYGCSREEVLGKDYFELFLSENVKGAVAADLKKVLSGEPTRGFENVVRVHDGSEHVLAWHVSRMLDSHGQPSGIIAVGHDVTERKQAERIIHQMAYYDALTNLPNRALFNDRLALELAHAQRNKLMLAVMYLDLDRFKVVNDTLGHTSGDMLLQNVAIRLVNCVRQDDTVARMGGDEFTLLLPGIKQTENAAKVAEKILNALRQPLKLNGRELYVTTSIGVALHPNDGTDVEKLIRNADAALYHAKEQGRNNFQFYTVSLHAKASDQLALESSLRRALDREEFVLHYQPKVNIKTRRIVGVEALVRWQHPEVGLVPPDRFIPHAENCGLIVPIDEWVLRVACAQNRAWQEAGLPPMRVSVNVSPNTFQQQKLVEMVTQALDDSTMKARFLDIEITESVAMQNVGTTINKLSKLNSLGVKLAIDDFGTGYSSLNYLKEFPIHTLKVDRSFVRDIVEDPDDAAIVSTIISLAQGLNLKVVAEGVETQEQLAFLKERRCDEIQGYFFSKPVPAEVLGEMLAQDKRLQL